MNADHPVAARKRCQGVGEAREPIRERAVRATSIGRLQEFLGVEGASGSGRTVLPDTHRVGGGELTGGVQAEAVIRQVHPQLVVVVAERDVVATDVAVTTVGANREPHLVPHRCVRPGYIQPANQKHSGKPVVRSVGHGGDLLAARCFEHRDRRQVLLAGRHVAAPGGDAGGDGGGRDALDRQGRRVDHGCPGLWTLVDDLAVTAAATGHGRQKCEDANGESDASKQAPCPHRHSVRGDGVGRCSAARGQPSSPGEGPKTGRFGGSRRLRFNSANPGNCARYNTASQRGPASSSSGTRLITGPKKAGPSGG